MKRPVWLEQAQAMRAEVPRRSWRAIGEALGVPPQTVEYHVSRRLKEGRADTMGPGSRGRVQLSRSRRGKGNPNYKDGARNGERPGTKRFKAAAGPCCENPDCRSDFRDLHQHHTIYRQELRSRGLDQWDPRGGMTLCVSCHSCHHRGSRRVPLRGLRDVNIDYAFEVLGAYAYDYLKRRYGGDDPRVERKLKEATQ